MKGKYVITFLCAIVLIFGNLLYHVLQPSYEKSVTVGFLYIGDASDAYTKNFMKAQEAVKETFGSQVKTVVKYNVAEGEAANEAIDSLIQSGCDIIFGTSFGYGEAMKQHAEKNPKIQFCQASCYNSKDPELDNYHTFMGFAHEGRYVSGVAAGMKLKEMINKGEVEGTPWIGYVAAFPYAEVISGYTAFYLGVQSIVPDVQMKVKYSNSWNDYKTEKRITKDLIEEGCVIISQHSDTTGPAVACENAKGEHDVIHVSYNQSMTSIAPTTSLIGCRINWEPYIVGAVDAMLMEKGIETCVKGRIYGNDIGAGFGQNWVQMLELNEVLAAEGTVEAIEKTIALFQENSTFEIFRGEFVGVNPYDETDTYDLREGFREGESQSAPSFCYVLSDVIHVEE